jgi:hypothetical protein
MFANESFPLPAWNTEYVPNAAQRPKSDLVSYVVAVTSIAVVVGLFVAGRGAILQIAIPALAMLMAVSLYRSRPVAYMQYAIWVWLLAPLVRRIADWRFGFTEPNLILTAPLLVSAVAGLTLVLRQRRAGSRIPASFILCGAAILYGFVVAVALQPSAEKLYDLFNWLCPMLFGLHLFLTWSQNPNYPSALAKTFLRAVVILGIYGIYQYLAPPAWDRYWLENVMVGGQSLSFGRPEPFQLRVWSTLNSPGPFADFMLAGVLILFAFRSVWKLPAAIAGYLTLLLSLVRTAWLSWLVGLFVYLRKSNPRAIARVLVLGVALIACLLPWINDPRMSNVLGDRFNTLSNVSQDNSYQERLSMYHVLATDVLNHPFGYGLNNFTILHNVAVDSGILSLILTFGWCGSLVFAFGILGIFFMNGTPTASLAEFSQVSKAISLALLFQIIGGNIFVSVTGMVFWVFAAVYMATVRSSASETASAFAAPHANAFLDARPRRGVAQI